MATGLFLDCPHCLGTGIEQSKNDLNLDDDMEMRVRDALGKHNDEEKPVTECVHDLVTRLDEVEDALSIALPYIETAKDDPVYRCERVAAVLKKTTAVLLGK